MCWRRAEFRRSELPTPTKLWHFLLEEADNVAAILTDVMMPGTMDGLQLAGMVARQWPHIIVLVTSGRVRPLEELPANVQFIAKPWKPSQVVDALQRAALAA